MARGKKPKVKKWFTVLAPKFFEEKPLGEVLGSTPESLLNRTLEAPLIDLTGDYERYYYKVKFRIVKVEEEKAFTEIDELICLQDYVSRLVRKRTTRIDTVQDVVTKDGKAIRVKCLMISYRRVTNAIEKAMRKGLEELVKKEAESSNFEEFFRKVISGDFEKLVKEKISKIYPLRGFVVRKIEVKGKV